MDTLLQDLRHTLRTLLRSPGFTLAAVAALALGIGATIAVFSIVNTVLLRSAPFPDSDRIVWLQVVSPQGRNPGGSPAKFAWWRGQTAVLRDVAAFRDGRINDTGGDVPEQLRWTQVSADYFRLFGAPIVAGRAFAPEEDLPNGPKAALISERLWERRFDRDPGVIGRALSLSAEPHVVVGVVGDGFDFRDFGAAPDVWTPFQLDPNATDQGHYFIVAGRLAPGVSLAQAQTALEQSTEAYRQRFPDAVPPAPAAFGAEPIRDALVRNAGTLLLVLLGAVGFVLLIACANVANLQLVRAIGRQREIALRTALGAGRGRLLRQLLTESVVLSLIGGALGFALGVAGIRALLSVSTVGLPRIGPEAALVAVDWRVALFAVAVSAGAGVLFGLIPALQGSRTDPGAALKEGGGRAGAGAGQNRMRALLVVGEVALASILLIGAALLIRTSIALGAVDPGFDAANVLTMRTSLTGPRFATAGGVEALLRQGVDRVRALPGVEHAAATCCVPLTGGFGLPFVIAGRPLDDGPFHGGGGWTTVSDGFFEVFRIPTLRGRVFTDRDGSGAPPVVVINETMANQYWPDGDPLAGRIVIGRGVMRQFADEPERQIIGVVADVRDAALNADPQSRMYVPQAQLPDGVSALSLEIAPMGWTVRTRTSPGGLSAAIQAELRLATGLPVSDVRTMDEVVSRSTARQRFNMLLMTIFGAAALALAAIGVYGLTAYSVEQRTQEIGVRLALGAETAQVWRMVSFQGMRLVAVGVVVGLLSASGLTRVIAGFLFGVEALDPATFVAVPVTLAAVALCAVAVPARRASRVDPVLALRRE